MQALQKTYCAQRNKVAKGVAISMRQYVTAFVNSFGNIAWLKAERYNFRLAWRYYVLLLLLASLILAVPAGIAVHRGLTEFRQRLSLAPDFTIANKGGVVTANGLPEPFTLADERGEYVLVVDTRTSTPPALPSASLGGITIGRDKAVIADQGSGQSQEFPWNSAPDGSFTKGDALKWIDDLLRPSGFAPAALAGFVVLFIGQLFSRAYALLLVVLLVYVMARLMKKEWRFKELFTVGLFGSTLPLAAALILSPFLPVPVFYPALAAFMLAAVFTKDAEKEKK